MSAALRTTQATPSVRPLGAALAGVVVAAAILGLLVFGQLTAAKPQTTAPAAGIAPVLHDRGWATAPAAGIAPVLHDRGWATAPAAGTGGSNLTRFPK